MGSRGRDMRAARRAAQFAKFRITELNLVPLVDTLVSIVFFALTTATVGELSPVVPGVRLPEAHIGAAALQQLTLGVGPQVTLGGRPIMSTLDAARTPSNDASQPLLIPPLYTAMRVAADSIRRANKVGAGLPLDVPLAIQGDKSMRYDLLARMMQTARLAGFRNLSLQVSKQEGGLDSAAAAPGAR
ncbi:MAG TPA: biopolymer transporter ExbD [Vicinamibacterales bacterium]|jgi:biopolymer transport protein ExbD|nr:biopolymer transporter ExbD [Vicinamibacterales bacterium]HTL96970.1 biopolymer transporter ExbD [Gemmatimonadaceae bacterium]